MDRRKSLKILATGAIATGAVVIGCTNTEQNNKVTEPKFNLDRAKEEFEREKKLLSEPDFFTVHEMKTITVLADIIIPADEISGSASEAKVPEFIAFIVKDMPSHQVPMKGGLRWLDIYCLKKYDKSFFDCTPTEQLSVVDKIAFPKRAKPEMSQGVKFFSLMRDLTSTGFYTSQEGVKDIGYKGNTPNQWNGVPTEVLAQYGLTYSEKELFECIRFDS
ncbi:MAG: gluconate 2-dehydrogenase subunit 3 family protein [Chitinophagaceae bacterium]|nr:MAG: gluconate 2-dehydrogenase subunit 3 family protein [Chitinophagaceae bacterium]